MHSAQGRVNVLFLGKWMLNGDDFLKYNKPTQKERHQIFSHMWNIDFMKETHYSQREANRKGTRETKR